MQVVHTQIFLQWPNGLTERSQEQRKGLVVLLGLKMESVNQALEPSSNQNLTALQYMNQQEMD